MAGGRPRQLSEGFCPNPKCRKPGSPFDKYVPRNNSTDYYFYPWFRHSDGSKPCDLTKILKKFKARVGVLTEYADRSEGNEATDFRYYPRHRHRILKQFPIKGAHISKALPVVIFRSSRNVAPNLLELCQDCSNKLYYIHDLRCRICNNTTIMWCPKCQRHWDFSKKVPLSKIYADREGLMKELEKSNIEVAELQDINWFLNVSGCDNKTSNKISKGACNFLKRLSEMHSKSNIIVTYGDKASENVDRISRRYNCEYTCFTDMHGVFDKLKKKVGKRNRLSKSRKAVHDNRSIWFSGRYGGFEKTTTNLPC